MSTQSPAIGQRAKLNGKEVIWSGNYGWQSPASYNKLQREGQFKVGKEAIDRLWNSLPQPVRAVAQEAQRRLANPIIPSKAETFGFTGPSATDKAIDKISNKTNVDPRLIQGALSIAEAAVEGRVGAGAARSAGQAQSLRAAGRLAQRGPAFGMALVPGPDDLVPTPSQIKRAAKRGVEPIVSPPHATGNTPPRVDITPGTPGPRQRRQLGPNSEAAQAASRAPGKGDPLSRGRAAAAADPPERYPHWQSSIDVPGRDQPIIRPQQGPLRPDPLDTPRQLRLENVDPRFNGRAEQRGTRQRTTVGPMPATQGQLGFQPGEALKGAEASRQFRAQQRLNRAQDTLRAQGVTGPLDGKPIGGRPMSREEAIRMRRLEQSGALDTPPERYRATGSGQERAFDDGPEWNGDRFNDTGGFDPITGDESNAGHTVRQSRNTGEGSGQRGATPPIRTTFDVERLRKDIAKAGLTDKVDNYRHLTKADQERVREQVAAIVRKYPTDSFGNNRPFKSGNSTLNDQVHKFLNERENPKRFNQIEAQDRGYQELPTRGKGLDVHAYANNPGYRQRIDVQGTANKPAKTAQRRDNIPGGREIPETAAEQARRQAIADRRASNKADRFSNDNTTPRQISGRQRVVQRPAATPYPGGGTRTPQSPGRDIKNVSPLKSQQGNNRPPYSNIAPDSTTSRTNAAWANQVERLSETRRLNDNSAAIFNALPVTMDDAIQQLRVHHGNAKAEKILNTKIKSVVDAGGNDVSVTVRDLIKEQIEEQAQRQGRARTRSRSTPNYDSFPPDAARPNTRNGLPEAGDNPPSTTKPTSRRGASQEARRQRRAENREGTPNLGNVAQHRADGTRQLTIPFERPMSPDPRTRSLSRSRGGANVSSAERIRAWNAATEAQQFNGSTMEWEGPYFTNSRDARAAGARDGRIITDGRTLYNDFQADGEVRGIRSTGSSTHGLRRNQLTPEEIKRRSDRDKQRVRASGSKVRKGTKNEAADRKRAETAARELREELQRAKTEMERIRAARARRRGNR